MVEAILEWYHGSLAALPEGATYKKIMSMDSLEKIATMKYQPEEEWDSFYAELKNTMAAEFKAMRVRGDEN